MVDIVAHPVYIYTWPRREGFAISFWAPLQRRRANHFLPGSKTMGSLTWPWLCQQPTFTQDLPHLGLPPLLTLGCVLYTKLHSPALKPLFSLGDNLQFLVSMLLSGNARVNKTNVIFAPRMQASRNGETRLESDNKTVFKRMIGTTDSNLWMRHEEKKRFLMAYTEVLGMSGWKRWAEPSGEVISIFHIFEVMVEGNVWQEQGRK